jgi:phospholipid-binding protein, PBP family
VEPSGENPDVVPDVYETNNSAANSSMLEDTASSDGPIGTLSIYSSAFENGSFIPDIYTCDGDNINPPLEVLGISGDTVSLLLIMDDPDAPIGTFTHWVVWNIDPEMQIAENSIPGIEGANGANKVSYAGPCPPSGTHRYFFKMYALDTDLDIESGSERGLVEDAMEGHVIAYGELIGVYSRS